MLSFSPTVCFMVDQTAVARRSSSFCTKTCLLPLRFCFSTLDWVWHRSSQRDHGHPRPDGQPGRHEKQTGTYGGGDESLWAACHRRGPGVSYCLVCLLKEHLTVNASGQKHFIFILFSCNWELNAKISNPHQPRLESVVFSARSLLFFESHQCLIHPM